VAQDRQRGGRWAGPTAAVIDTQSVKTTEAGGPRGFDAEVGKPPGLLGWRLLPATKQRRCGFPACPGRALAVWPSIATISARRHDGSELIEIEIDDGLQGHGGGSVAEAIRKTSYRAAYSACRASSPAARSFQRCKWERRSTGRR
jgi:hypothetical protein